ncbi:ClbS/DfsB family four-helix bundle protein [Aquimarina longa]|uniref:ClbS/DfsB family four-helix bundle protein n=1 Tax=Aquimarina longa TaxID=1080221 RepID=UPI000783EFE7|nr:ClbS/DfsB family four-helix bundle protein [Aquimarina longa]
MAVPKNKEELIFSIKDSYSKLKKDLDTIPVRFSTLKEMEGHAKGTKMSVCNLVSYLIGWGELVLKWNRGKINGKEVDFPETGYKWNELGKLAQKFYLDYEKLEYKALLTKLEHTVHTIIALVESIENSDLYEQPWYDKWPIGKMIQLNTSSPYKNARSRIRKWKKLNLLK